MKDRPAYKVLRQVVKAKGFTIQQVRDATPQQVLQLTNLDKHDVLPYLEGMKLKIIEEMKAKAEQIETDTVKAQFKNWLDTNFPGNVIEQDNVDGKPVVMIWYKGKS